MRSDTIRRLFIEFFEQKGHKFITPSSVINNNDPTLMFTNAGMNQFKDFFTDDACSPLYSRAVNVQPCIRVSGKHNDLEEVGHDTYHHTLFEMMGSWSFGDYFKEEAIAWAWELLTNVYKIPKDRLYVTVFGGDTNDLLDADVESYEIWKKYIEPDKILNNCIKKDNFWEMGDTGPCGVSSEIHIDIRSNHERSLIPGKSLVNTGHSQVIELWNLVFIQYNRFANGLLKKLSNRYVDTGMGFERLAMILQGKHSNYDTDIFMPIINHISDLSKKKYGSNQESDIAHRVIADHIRAVTFSIADGQKPSNTKTGYVIRRILRRAVRYGYTYLGLQEPFMYKLLDTLVEHFGSYYQNIATQKDYIGKVLYEEEEAFFRTLVIGLNRLDQIIKDMPSELKQIDGTVAFELYDTYGFPLDLTTLIAKEHNLTVNEARFNEDLQAQRERSKKAACMECEDWVQVNNSNATTFVGYDTFKAESKIIKWRKATLHGNQIYHIVLEKTPFYAEGGGQVGDKGCLISMDSNVEVLDTKLETNTIIHYVNKLPNDLKASFQAIVNSDARIAASNNHTATHLLHAALVKTLGTHVEQRGSLVNENGLRFDFSHHTKLTSEELIQIESIVNEKIRANIPLDEKRDVPFNLAKSIGATSLAGEKYGERVRVITFDCDFSVSLCGGTHAKATGQLGLFKIVRCSSIASGIRRIEAITAKVSEKFVRDQANTLNAISSALNNPKDIE